MRASVLRKNLIKRVEKLHKKELEELWLFTSALSNGSNKATEELLAIPGLVKEVKQAKKQFQQGKGIDWRIVRSDI
jgi:hypothetical protein